jgi:hypothetical protein
VKEKDRKLADLQIEMKNLKNDFQEKINNETREKENIKARSEKEHIEFVELQAKYN